MDLDEISEKQLDQVDSTVNKFPPPLPPIVPPQYEFKEGGILVPFIYPPIPVLRPDKYLADPVPQKRRGRRSAAQIVALARHSLPDRIGIDNEEIYLAMPPLPFPPANFMPYPLISDQSTLIPEDVFGDWLDALQHLPRVNMVVASAAGSTFDLRAHANSVGMTIAKLEEWVRTHPMESDPEAEDRSESESSELESAYEDYADYADQVDITNAYDKFPEKVHNQVVVNSRLAGEYAEVVPRVSAEGKTYLKRGENTYEYADRDIEEEQEFEMPAAIISNPSKDVVNAVGAQKEKRRGVLLRSFQELEAFAQANRAEIYATKKRELLARLRLLQQSKIYFEDNKTHVEDDELERYLSMRRSARDEELLRLKLHHTYEQLKAALAFYQTSNRIYKSMNSLLVNKLQKLKYFLEYQKLLFGNITRNTYEGEVLNIRSKESAKLYNSFSDRDFASEIKEVFRVASANEDQGMPYNTNSKFDSSAISKVYTGRAHTANVHDFMPLVTEEEFNLITGDAPTKNGPGKENGNKGKTAAKHLIYQSPLYERAASGSDTNASDSTASNIKRRPGRRAAPKPGSDEPSKEHSEAALVAKIMKQFVGPAAANGDELSSDLEMMGVKTKWPVK